RSEGVVRGRPPRGATWGLPAVHRPSCSRSELRPQLYHRVECPAKRARRTARSPRRGCSSDGSRRSAAARASDTALYVRSIRADHPPILIGGFLPPPRWLSIHRAPPVEPVRVSH